MNFLERKKKGIEILQCNEFIQPESDVENA